MLYSVRISTVYIVSKYVSVTYIGISRQKIIVLVCCIVHQI